MHCRRLRKEEMYPPRLRNVCLSSIEGKDVNGETFPDSEDMKNDETFKDSKPPVCQKRPFVAFSEYGKMLEYCNALHLFSKLTGDTKLEGVYLSLGCLYYVLGYYDKSIIFFEKAVGLSKETNDKEIERRAYTNLALALETVGQREKAHDCIKRALYLCGVNGYQDAKQCCMFYTKQGMLNHEIGEYEKSIKCHEMSLQLSTILCDQYEQGTSHYNLGTVYCTLGHYKKSIKHHKKCLEIRSASGDMHGQGISCTQLAYLHYILGEYGESINYQERSLHISLEKEAREMEMACYNNLGCVHHARGQYEKSIAFYEKWLDSSQTSMDRKKGKRVFRHLSGLFHAVGRHERAKRCQERAFSIDADNPSEFICSSSSDLLQEERFEIIEVMEGDEDDRFLIPRTARSHTSRLDVRKTSDYLSECIRNHELSRTNFNDECKLSFDDQSVSLFKTHSLLLASFGNANAALFAAEQGRAPALADLMRKTYGFQSFSNTTAPEIPINTISSLVEKQKSSFLFMAFLMKNLALWFVDKAGKLSFKTYSEPDPLINNTEDLLKTLSKEIMDSIRTDQDSDARPNEEGDYSRETKRDLCLQRLYNAIIAPIANFIEGPEIIIVAEGQMFLIPFAALRDENGVYLSETLKIRLIPSFTSLRLIQDSPTNYHCHTGALIVGDPTIGLEAFPPLPAAREEVEMISAVLGVPCLVGEQATKEAVLLNIEEVCLVHLACHGCEETGEPALAPGLSFTGNPKKEDVVVTMEEIARLTIRAKLVVLSTCYSAHGKVMAGEGIVGIARAFLGSGARSVLVSLWPVEDEPARFFMYIFYKYLVLEKMTASDSLHRTQKEMRSTWEFKDEKDWASFVLIGDDVSIDIA